MAAQHCIDYTALFLAMNKPGHFSKGLPGAG